MTSNSNSNSLFTRSGDDRAALRRERIAARLALSPGEHHLLSQQLEVRLDDFLAHHPPGVLGFYWPCRNEFDCRPLVARLIQQQPALRVCLPVVQGSDAPLLFRQWTEQSPLATDRYGIPYPAAGAVLMPDTLLIPVNVFDGRGYRLGYGAGYFDRTLAALNPRPLAIGTGFELARVACVTPQPHDIPLDVVVTEAATELFSDFARQHGSR